MKMRILSIILTLSLVFGLVPFHAITSYAEATKGSWGDVYDITWYTDIKASSYHISTAEQLAGLAYLVNARKTEFLNETVYLDADINLAGKEWIPIDWGGWTDYPRGCPGFRGTLDGQGHTVSNMTITSIKAGAHAGTEPVGAAEYYTEIGLFGRMDGLLNNLNMQSANITLPDNEAYKVLKAGFLCGSLCDDTNPPSETITTRGIFGCTVTNSIIKGNAIEYADVFAAFIYNNTTISGCKESGNQIITNTMWSGCYDQDMVASYDSTTTFVIKTEEELAAISALSSSGKDFSGKTVSLANDLDMSQYTWSSIPVFNGIFEGNNHAIAALRISMIPGDYYGFISTTSSCTIRNLTIDIGFDNMVNKDFYSNCGGLIGNALNATVIVENCSVYGAVGMQEKNDRAGAIIGYASHSNVTINKTNNYATIIGGYAGGFVGQAWAGNLTITNSVNAGSVYSFSKNLGCAAGGIVGVAENINLRLDKCAVVQLDVNTGGSLRISGKEQSGGFIGVVNDYFKGVSDVTIRNSYCLAQVVATTDDSVASAFFNILYSHSKSPLAVNITASYFGGTLTYEGSKKASNYLYLCFYVNKDEAPKYNVSCNDTYLLAHFKADSNGDGKVEDLRNYGGIDVTNGGFTNSSYRHFQVINTWGSTSTFDRKEVAVFKNFDFLKSMNDVSYNADKNNANIWASKNSTNDVYQYGMPYLSTSDIDVHNIVGKKVSTSNIAISGAEKSDLLYTSYRNFSSAYGKADGSSVNPWQSAYVATGMTFRINTYNSTNDELLDFSRQLFNSGDEISLFIVNADKDGYTGDRYTYTVTGSENNYSDTNGALIGKIYFKDFKNAAGIPFSAGSAGSRSLYFKVKFGEKSNAALSDTGECYLRYMNSKSACAKNVFLKANDLKLSLGKYEGGTVSVPDSIYSGAEHCYFGNLATGIKVDVAANRGYQITSLKFKDTMSNDEQLVNINAGAATWVGYWKGASGSASVWTVEAQFEKRAYSVSFSGANSTLCSEDGTAVDLAAAFVKHGESYSFKIKANAGYLVTAVTANENIITPDENGVYTVKNNIDSLKIKATAFTKTNTAVGISASPGTQQTRPGSVTLSAVNLPQDAVGTLTFMANNEAIASVNVGQSAAFFANGAVNDYSFSVIYSGDSAYNGSTSAPVNYSFVKGTQAALNFGTYDTAHTYGADVLSMAVVGGSGEGAVNYSSSNTRAAIVDSFGNVTIVGTGSFTITATKAADDDYNVQSKVSDTITVKPKPVTVVGVMANDKTYDGNQTATIKTIGTIDGIVSGDSVEVSRGTLSFGSKNAGIGVAVTAQGFSLVGEAAENYILSAQPDVANATISRATLSVTTEKISIKKGQKLPPLIVSVGGFVNGESEALDGFSKPTATAAGSYDTADTTLKTVDVSYFGGEATANYMFDLTATSADIEISTVLATFSDFTADKDISKWQTSAPVLTPANGYSKISTDEKIWSDSLVLPADKKSIVIYLQAADGTQTEGLTVSYLIDSDAPIVEIKQGESNWNSFLNTVTFGFFFNEEQMIEIIAEDSLSGVYSVEYLLSDSVFDTKSSISGSWQPLSSVNGKYTFALEKESKQFVYARVTDAANNQTIVNSEGIVIYTDSALATDSAEFNFDRQEDIAIKLDLGKNTLNEVKADDMVLLKDTDYLFDGNTVTIKKEYTVAALTGEVLNLTFSFNPMGEECVETKNPPKTAIFTVRKHNHTWDAGTIKTEPTELNEGKKAYSCIGCGFTKTEAIPKLLPKQTKPEQEQAKQEQEDKSPQTLDKNDAFLLAALFFVSGGMLALAGIIKKRGKESNK